MYIGHVILYFINGSLSDPISKTCLYSGKSY